MKRIIALALVFGLGIAAYAGPVTPEKALQVASKVFAAQPSTKGAVASDLKIVWDGEFEQTKAATDPAFYVVTRKEGGFVIVAGNDNAQPILGFSFENPFQVEGMPDNVRWWMEQLKAYSRSATVATPEAQERWMRFADTKAPLSGTFEDEFMGSRTVQWNQTNPANYYCPTVTGESGKSVCGCVALALSEVMTWFGEQNAPSGTGTVEEYTQYGGFTIPAHDLGTVYRWAELQTLETANQFYAQNGGYTYADYYGTPENITELGKNLGQLVYDIGTILQVDYGEEGTAGNLSRLSYLAEMMHYNKSALEVNRSSYSQSKWDQMLKEEITLRPVYYTGSDPSAGGHAYVADGYATYNGDLVFHYNLGWGGSGNGYYYSSPQTPNSYSFGNNSAMFDFYPDPSGTSSFLHRMGYLKSGGVSLYNSFDSSHIYLTLSMFLNTGNTATYGTLAVYKVDKNGEKGATPLSEETLGSSEAPLPAGSGWYEYHIGFNRPSNLVLGDKVAVYYKEAGAAEYKPVDYPENGSVIGELPRFPAAFIKTEASYSVGDYFVFALHNHDYHYNESTWTVTDPNGDVSAYTMDDYRVQLTQAGEYKIEVNTPDKEKVVAYIQVK